MTSTQATNGRAADRRPSTLPTGMVAFLFTDIVDSTPLWEQMPDEMRISVAQHHALLRQAIEAQGGYVFLIVGDSFQAVFRLASQALNAAVEAQRLLHSANWGMTSPLKVRMGLHIGPAELDERGDSAYQVSHTLNRAARVMSAGSGGQILLSQEAADLVKHDLSSGAALKDLGEHQLKGMQHKEHLYQLVVPDLPQVFPPLATRSARRNNLPAQLTTFIGREKEIGEVIHLLNGHRFITIHGSGGTGKTRLCLQVGALVLESYPDGVWFIELAPLTDADKIPQLIATTLGLYDSRGRSALDLIIDFLSGKHLLLFLDNCEHHIQACAQLAEMLLHHCPQLTIMVSSRETVSVSGETTYRLPSLSIPDLQSQRVLEQITQFESVRLFEERTAAILPDFMVTEANASAVVQICRRLDGIPLAIELAAARMDLLNAEQIAARLDHRFRLLTGGSRTALPRQQTLRASIDWSYSLLTETERLLLQRLSVFAGGWTLEAAEEVCGFERLEEYEVLDGLGQLVKKSLVVSDSQMGASARYRLLETIRQYAREKLLDSGRGAEIRDTHLGFYLKLAEQAGQKLRGPDQVAWNDRLEVEIDNLWAALEWSGESQIEMGLRIAVALKWFWHERYYSYRSEIEEWIDQALVANPLKSDPSKYHVQVWARAMAVQAFLLSILGKSGKKVVKLYEESLRLFMQLGQEAQGDLVFLYFWWAFYSLVRADWAQNQAMLRKSLSIAEAINDRFGIAESLPWVHSTNDLTEKLEIAKRGLAVRREIGDLEGIWWDLYNIARLYFALGDSSQALILNQEGMEICQQVKNRWGHALIWSLQGLIYAEIERYPEAISCLERSLQKSLESGDRYLSVVYEIELANILQQQGNEEAAKMHYHHSFNESVKEGYANEQAIIRFSQGEIAWAREDYKVADQYYREVIMIAQTINSDSSAHGLYGLGKIAFARGERLVAWDYLCRSLRTWINVKTNDYIAQVFEAMAVLAASPAQDNLPSRAAAIFAARLHGAGYAMRVFSRLTFLTRPYFQRYDVEACLAPVRALLGEEAYAQAFAEGQAMKLEQAVEYALDHPELL